MRPSSVRLAAGPLYGGLRFGLLLQLAVGPVCLFVLQTGLERGVFAGLHAVAGVALVDAAYIALAGLGVTRWAESGRVRQSSRFGGAAIVALFGLDLVAGAAGWRLIPDLGGARLLPGGASAFLGATLLTAANPLTIVFWAGVFGAKVAAERYRTAELWSFSAGCVLATIAFLALATFGGSLLGRAAPAPLLTLLNLAVGGVLLFLAGRLAFGTLES